MNISGEATKHGLHPGELPVLLDKISNFTNLIPAGLMTIAPLVDEPEQVRPIFRRLKSIFDESAKGCDANWRYLSMGMSQDYQVAVEEGANMIRIGTAYF